MRVGVFISGQLRKNTDANLMICNDLLRDAFPDAKFFYHVYEEEHDNKTYLFENIYDGKVMTCGESEVHYSPYLDNPNLYDNEMYRLKVKGARETGKKIERRNRNAVKQILHHNNLIKRWGGEVDVIVRTRYDVAVSPVYDFSQWVEQVYNDHSVVAIANRFGQPSSSMGRDYDTMPVNNDIRWPTIEATPDRPYFIMKNMKSGGSEYQSMLSIPFMHDNGIIIHRTEDWDCKLVDHLYERKKLLPGEWGWWQILIRDFAANKKWSYLDGGAQIASYLPKKKDWKDSFNIVVRNDPDLIELRNLLNL